ncbi:MAG: prepilin peptidase [Candidatus Heimdallarchaeota archaeon]|nr:MAG: prepilin peptidase [Candidatus Heimdallarchaeota archaeon]
MIGSELNLILLILTFFLLIIGSWQDLKTREVADWIWLTMIGGGIIIHIIQIILRILENEPPINYFVPVFFNIIFAITLAMFLTFSGLGGEADRIAYIAIGVASPISPPFFIFQNPSYEILVKITPKILNVFFNAYLIAFPAPILIFCYNLVYQRLHPTLYALSNESVWTRIFIRFIGYPHQTLNLEKKLAEKPWHFDFLEKYSEETGWCVEFRARLDTPEADFTRKQEIISSIQSKNKTSIWVQPSLPFVFILLLGFVTDVLIGNLLLLLMMILF